MNHIGFSLQLTESGLNFGSESKQYSVVRNRTMIGSYMMSVGDLLGKT